MSLIVSGRGDRRGVSSHHAGYENGYMFFYDETENSHKIAPGNPANANGLYPDKGDFYVGVFIGCRTKHLDGWRRKLRDVEDLIRSERRTPSDSELKSSDFKWDLKYGLASLKKDTKNQYLRILEAVDSPDLVFVAGFLSKREVLLRELMRPPSYVNEYLFFANLVRLTERYCNEDFFDAVVQDGEYNPEQVREFLAEKCREVSEAARGTEESELVRIMSNMADCVEDSYFYRRRPERIEIPYKRVFEWFGGFIDHIGIQAKRVFLEIDGEEGQYSEADVGGIRHRFERSDNDVMLRFCDLMAGPMSRLMKALYHLDFDRSSSVEILNRP